MSGSHEKPQLNASWTPSLPTVRVLVVEATLGDLLGYYAGAWVEHADAAADEFSP